MKWFSFLGAGLILAASAAMTTQINANADTASRTGAETAGIHGVDLSGSMLSGLPMQTRSTRAYLYDNGPFVTTPGGGAAGADISELQTALGMNTLGALVDLSSATRLADDFEVTDVWNIERLTFYLYQTDSNLVSTINDVRIQIWDGRPNAGGRRIWGDLTTNRLFSTGWTSAYRVTDSDPMGTTRPIMYATCTAELGLIPGTYWLDWSAAGTLASGPWQPPITIWGRTTTGNGMQFIADAWTNFIDTGTVTSQGFPFIIRGEAPPGHFISFDDLPNDTYIGDHYPDVTFSPGWSSWESINNNLYPPYSPPSVAFTHEVDNYIEWDDDLVWLSFYVNCQEGTGELPTFLYSVYDRFGMLLDTRTVHPVSQKLKIEFSVPGIRRLEIRGTNGWNHRHTIDHINYGLAEFLPCPPESVFSNPPEVSAVLNGFASDLDTPWVTADRYAIPDDERLQTLQWWGFGIDAPETEYTIRFYADNSGKPGTVVGSHQISATWTLTGHTFHGASYYEYYSEFDDIEIPAEGWISISGNAEGNSFFWSTSGEDPGEAHQYNGASWVMLNYNLAFCMVTSSACTELGCDIYMPSSNFGPGDNCYVTVYVCNIGEAIYTDIPVFVILDVYGMYYFAPSFGDFDYYNDPVPPGQSIISVLPSFSWPSDVGSASGLVWYAAMTDPGITQLHGKLGMFTFGWH